MREFAKIYFLLEDNKHAIQHLTKKAMRNEYTRSSDSDDAKTPPADMPYSRANPREYIIPLLFSSLLFSSLLSLTCILFVLSSWLFVRGKVSNLMTTVIPMMLTPQALELSPTFDRVEWISCSRNSIGRVRKPNHPFPASAAGAIASADPPDEAAMAAASAMASESRSASAIEERTCWREESTCGLESSLL